MKWYRNLGINKQLAIIVVGLVIGFSAIAFSYYRVLVIEESTDSKTRETAAYMEQVEQARLNLFIAQGFGKGFQVSNRLEELEGFDTTMSKGLESMAKLSTHAPTQETREQVTRLTELYTRYQTNFYALAEAKLSIGLDAFSGVLGDLSETTESVQSLVGETKQWELEGAYSGLREAEVNYFLLEQKDAIERVSKEQEALSERVGKLSISKAAKSELLAGLELHYVTFAELAEYVDARDQAAQNAQDDIALINPEFDRLTNLAIANVENQNRLASDAVEGITIVFVSTLAVTFVIVTGLLLLFARKIGRSLGCLSHAVAEVSQGNFEVRTNLTSTDELGSLGSAFDDMLADRLTQLSGSARENEQLNNSVITLMEAVSLLSENDLTVSVPVNEDVTGPISDAINLMIEETIKVLSEIINIAQLVGAASKAVRNQEEEVGKESAKEREIIDETMGQLEQAVKVMMQIASLAKSVNHAAIQTSRSTEAAVVAVDSTSNGMNDIREAISETEKRIKRLGERSQEINSAVDIINNIAERTHVLALNASMQAAAAGEAGRGSAVVADEVQRLAESSHSSTAQIGVLVNNIQTETAETMATMNKTIDKVVSVSDISRSTSEQMKKTQSMAQELSKKVQQIARHSINQAMVSKEIRDQAVKIQDSTKTTHEALDVQGLHTNKLVEFAQQLLQAVSVFKLPSTEKPVKPNDVSQVVDIRFAGNLND